MLLCLHCHNRKLDWLDNQQFLFVPISSLGWYSNFTIMIIVRNSITVFIRNFNGVCISWYFKCNESPSLVPRPSASTKVSVCACVCACNTFTSCQSDSLISFCHSSSYAKENWTRCVALISLHGSPPIKFYSNGVYILWYFNCNESPHQQY